MKKLKKLKLGRETLHNLTLNDSGLRNVAGGASKATNCNSGCVSCACSGDVNCPSNGSRIIACGQ